MTAAAEARLASELITASRSENRFHRAADHWTGTNHAAVLHHRHSLSAVLLQKWRGSTICMVPIVHFAGLRSRINALPLARTLAHSLPLSLSTHSTPRKRCNQLTFESVSHPVCLRLRHHSTRSCSGRRQLKSKLERHQCGKCGSCHQVWCEKRLGDQSFNLVVKCLDGFVLGTYPCMPCLRVFLFGLHKPATEHT